MKRIYLDYAAATPLDPRVREKMEPYFSEVFGNPSSVHQEGQQARAAIDHARKQVAQLLRAQPEEIVFTSGTTESINLALLGAHKKLGGSIAIPPTEHRAGLAHHEKLVVLTPEKTVEELIKEDVTLVSSLWTNNETGDIADIHSLAVRLHKADREFGRRPFLHSDIAQAIISEDISCERTPVDLLSFGAAKMYGPKGVGALFVRKGTPMAKLWSGGEQEHRLRPGTENVPGIVGFGEACALLHIERAQRVVHLQACKEAFLHALKKSGIEMRLNQSSQLHNFTTSPLHHSPHIVSITFFSVDAEELVLHLDARGIAASAASACKREGERSHVLRALGMSEPEIRTTVRFSFGNPLSLSDASAAGALTGDVVKRMLS
ncbi:MAG: cysteine desulfurase family protein [Patescibacteria group bacterium]